LSVRRKRLKVLSKQTLGVNSVGAAKLKKDGKERGKRGFGERLVAVWCSRGGVGASVGYVGRRSRRGGRCGWATRRSRCKKGRVSSGEVGQGQRRARVRVKKSLGLFMRRVGVGRRVVYGLGKRGGL
jgi:hypothetical protein